MFLLNNRNLLCPTNYPNLLKNQNLLCPTNYPNLLNILYVSKLHALKTFLHLLNLPILLPIYILYVTTLQTLTSFLHLLNLPILLPIYILFYLFILLTLITILEHLKPHTKLSYLPLNDE